MTSIGSTQSGVHATPRASRPGRHSDTSRTAGKRCRCVNRRSEVDYLAVTGNLGLAEYALAHGLPVNSVLRGVLPLHAACSNGPEEVIKLLLEYGADGNAAGPPRKRTMGRNKFSVIIGTTGATPLHFAAANGHTRIVGLLLSHGARADQADKQGVTPLRLAQQQGHEAVVERLEAWLAIHP